MDKIPSFSKPIEPVPQQNPKADPAEEISVIFDEIQPTENFSVKTLVGAESEVWNPDYDGASFSPAREPSAPRLRQMDYALHNCDTFPHMHHPLQPHFHRHKNRKKDHGRHRKKSDSVKFDVGDPDLEEGWSTKTIDGQEKTETPMEKVKSFSDTDAEDTQELLPLPPPRQRTVTENSIFSTDDEGHEIAPLISPEHARLRSIMRPSETDTEDERKRGKVKFNIGQSEKAKNGISPEKTKGSDPGDSDHEKPPKQNRRRRHHHHHRRKPAFSEDPSLRRHRGSETLLKNYDTIKPTTDDEAEQLRGQDLNEMSSHRFADSTHHRRHRIKAKSLISTFFHPSATSSKGGDRKLPIMKKSFDHTPHEIFVELNELQYTDGSSPEWKETARWIKYEEDVEGADNRWGKPHIAFLDFNALFSLRKGLDRGAVLLDLDEKELPNIATRVVDHMVTCDQIPFDQRDAVIRILLLRHKHIREQPNLMRRASRATGLHLLGSLEKLPHSQSGGANSDRRGSRRLSNLLHVNTFSSFGRRSSSEEPDGKDRSRTNSFTQINMEDGGTTEIKDKLKQNKDIMKKIPEGAEATAVLVGAVDFLKTPTIAFVRLAEGVVMENLIEVPIPVRFMFVLLGPFQGEMDYHEVGRSISTLMSDKSFHEVAYKAHTRGQLLAAINDFLNASIVLPPSDWNDRDLIPFDQMRAKSQEILRKTESIRAQKEREAGVAVKPAQTAVAATDDGGGDDKKPPTKRDPLQRTGKLFHGMIEDIKGRFPQYLSDITDGLNSQVLSAIVFIFFASLSPSITFGGIYADQTNRYIGVGETLLVTSINGMIFALVAAQPLLIVGASGPLMIFDMSLLNFCNSMSLDYLSLRVWVGLWMLVIGFIVCAFELVAAVKKFTRFTEEIFSSLVCLIFIYGAFDKLASIFRFHPLGNHSFGCYTDLNKTRITDGWLVNGTLFNATTIDGDEVGSDEVIKNQPNTALLSMCLMLGTFLIAFKLKKFRNSKYLGRGVRRALGDFGVPISIVVMVLIDYFIKDTYTDKLSMPSGLQPSNSEIRGWLINPFGVVSTLPMWAMIAAGPAALLLFILIFLEENICHLILSKPERCLKKGTGFHWDMMLACITATISGFLGAPFMGPACVRTISHMSALTIMSTNVAPGESPKIVGCNEQRVSAFFVSLLVGLAVFLYAVLNMVPTSVLLGIFLYMGVSATAGIQLIERTILFFMPVKHHPNVAYVKKVRTWKMNCFTALQILMLVILWIVMQSPAALCVPFILGLLIPVRLFLIPKFFDAIEIAALDGTEQKAMMESPHDEPDFFEAMHDLPPMDANNHKRQS